MSPASTVCVKVRDRSGSVSNQNQSLDTNGPIYRLFVSIDSLLGNFASVFPLYLELKLNS